MLSGPTKGATEGRAWTAGPRKAVAVRALIVVLPMIASFVTARLASPALVWFDGGFGLILYLAQVAVVGSVAALLAGRAARHLLPLASLLNMTLVFPDRAPSRFGLALRAGTLRNLKASLVDEVDNWGDDHQQAAEHLVSLLGALGGHDRLTRGHTERVRAFSALIGSELGLSETEQQHLQWAAMAHDVGKLTVPTEILNKAGRPSEEEWAVLSNHPAAGGELLEPLADWLGPWRLAASQHHERWDGAGYPAGLAGNEISLAGRIVAVADAYDVITSSRSYKKAMTHEAARQELVRCSGNQFDPDVVRAMLQASLGHDRAVVGFFGWFTELGGWSAIPRTVGQVVVAAGSTVALVAGTVAMEDEPADEPITIAAVDPGEEPEALPYTTDPPALSENDVEVGVSTEKPTTTSSTTTTVKTSTSSGSTSTPATTETTAAPTTTAPTTTTTSAAPTTTTMAAPTTTTTTAAPTTTTSTTPPGQPLAVDDSVSVDENKDIKISVLDNDDSGSAPFDEATLEIVVDPTNAEEFRVHNDHIHYKSIEDFDGVDTLRYRICNNDGLCHEADVIITVTDD